MHSDLFIFFEGMNALAETKPATQEVFTTSIQEHVDNYANLTEDMKSFMADLGCSESAGTFTVDLNVWRSSVISFSSESNTARVLRNGKTVTDNALQFEEVV